MKEITLTSRKKISNPFKALVSDEDFELVSGFTWYVFKSSNTNYALNVVNKKTTYMHRLILGVTDPQILVDHKDGNGLNNTRENLRKCTGSQNMMNKRKSWGVSKYFGVSRHTIRGKYHYWRVCLMVNKKNVYVKEHKDEVDAARDYDRVAKIYHGEFASLNFPDNG